MKKILFITPLMVVSLLASCGNNNPQKDEYTVTEQEMKDAFAMKDVEYLQVNQTQEDLGGSFKQEFTPNSYHHITNYGGYYSETLILKDGDIYYKYERENKEIPFAPVVYEEGDFQTIAEYMDETFGFLLKEKEYSDFYYSEEREEYMTYAFDFGSIEVLLFQFLNKKLSKLINYVPDFDDEVIHKVNYTFTYDRIEPPSPTI